MIFQLNINEGFESKNYSMEIKIIELTLFA